MSLFLLIKSKYSAFKYKLYLMLNAKQIDALQTNCEILEKHLAWFEKFHESMGGEKLHLYRAPMEDGDELISYLKKQIKVLMEQIEEVIARIRGMYVVCVGEDLDAWNEYLRKRQIYKTYIREVDWLQQ